ncbi:MAG: bifunctional (p)ppGpp synthetase/guanosine-3',5'-bis(diphosphate) 3'-pyrophosphohydrolase [Clostridiales bacterium]|nr:bifunctional (p)ppGpp synthetase/guanosine-3',5'-bis(diphosphate) 3'-pyrophosphohydrolase [Clostridiales bacterium]
MHIDTNEEIDIDEVLAFATERHKGQVRADGSDYITHPIRVSKLVSEFKPSRNGNILAAGALLHDVLEDTYTSYKELCDRFGIVVASLVMEVTSSGFMPKLVGKRFYLAHKMQYMSSYALVIKLADRLDNLTDMRAVALEKIKRTYFDTIYMINYLESKRNLTEPQKNLIVAIRGKLEEINKEYQLSADGLIVDTDLDQD